MNNIEDISREFKKLRILRAARDLEDADLIELLGMLIKDAELRFGVKSEEKAMKI